MLTVAHREFLDFHINGLLEKNGVVYDVKGVMEEVDERLRPLQGKRYIKY